MKVNFSAVSDSEIVPVGEYDLVITDYKVKDSKSSPGEFVVACVFTVTGGDYDGRKVFQNYSLQPQALWKIKRDLVRLGLNPTDISDDVDIEDLLSSVIGNEVSAKVTHTEKSGRKFTSVEISELTNSW